MYSDDEEQDDLLVSLVQQIRKKKPAKSRRRRRSASESEESEKEERRGSQSGHRKSKRRRRRKTTVLDKVDRILELKKELKKKYSEGRMMKKVDKILFSDISSSVSKEERTKARDRFLDEVDDILGLGRKQEESSESSDEESEEKEEEEEEELTEAEMRLLNLINHNKIDVKVNWPAEYRGDTDCHFCRKKETSLHLAKCPVYQGIMRGSEFRDLRSRNLRLVKSALENIKSALVKRSEALAVTSLGGVSAANMSLLNLSPASERRKTKAEIIDEILATT